MKTIVVMIAMLLGTVAFANDQYAPKQNERINLYKVVSENENAPMYSGYFRDSQGVVHQVAVWAGASDKYLEGSVTIPTTE